MQYMTNLMKIMSVCPDFSITFLREEILSRMDEIMHMLVASPDANVRAAVSDIVTHALVVACNFFEIEIDSHFSEAAYTEADLDNPSVLVMTVVSRFANMLDPNGMNLLKKYHYMRFEPYLRLFYTMVKLRHTIGMWLIKNHQMIKNLLGMLILMQTSTWPRTKTPTLRA